MRRENRQTSGHASLKFPREMLDRVTETRSIMTARGGNSILYLVLEETRRGGEPVFEVHATTQDLELANELAIARFRYNCPQGSPGDSTEFVDLWVQSHPEDDWHSPLEWWLEKNLYVHLRALDPESGDRVRVWVTRQDLLTRC